MLDAALCANVWPNGYRVFSACPELCGRSFLFLVAPPYPPPPTEEVGSCGAPHSGRRTPEAALTREMADAATASPAAPAAAPAAVASPAPAAAAPKEPLTELQRERARKQIEFYFSDSNLPRDKCAARGPHPDNALQRSLL